MTWLPSSHYSAISDCCRYAIAGEFRDGAFAWRGELIATNELIASSADRSFVEQQCERHAAKLDAEVA